MCNFAFLLSHTSCLDQHSNHRLFVPTITERRQLFLEEIGMTQDRVTASIGLSNDMVPGANPSSAVHITASSPQKRPHSDLDGSISSALTGATIDFDNVFNSGRYSCFASAQIKLKKNRHATLWETPRDPAAVAEIDVAITDLALGNLFPFKFGEDAKLLKVLSIARRLPLNYVPLNRNRLGDDFPQAL